MSVQKNEHVMLPYAACSDVSAVYFVSFQKHRLRNVLTRIKGGAKRWSKRLDSSRAATRRGKEASAWLNFHIRYNGDYMPHVAKIHLDPGSWSQVHELYQFQHPNKTVIGLRQFRRIRKEQFPDVVIPKRKNFTTCTTCDLLRIEKRKALTKADKTVWH